MNSPFPVEVVGDVTLYCFRFFSFLHRSHDVPLISPALFFHVGLSVHHSLSFSEHSKLLPCSCASGRKYLEPEAGFPIYRLVRLSISDPDAFRVWSRNGRIRSLPFQYFRVGLSVPGRFSERIDGATVSSKPRNPGKLHP